jgi:hypothetical protein
LEAEIMATKSKKAKSTRKPAPKAGRERNTERTVERPSLLEMAEGRSEALREIGQLLKGLQTVELVDILAVLRRYSVRGTLGMYSFSAEDLDVADQLLDHGPSDVDHFAATDLAIYIHNHGTMHDRADALASVFPIARRVYERDDAKQIQTNDAKA